MKQNRRGAGISPEAYFYGGREEKEGSPDRSRRRVIGRGWRSHQGRSQGKHHERGQGLSQEGDQRQDQGRILENEVGRERRRRRGGRLSKDRSWGVVILR